MTYQPEHAAADMSRDTDQPTASPVAKAEETILAFWNERKIFAKSLEQRKGNDSYVFYDGPPFATGTPHYGHILASTIKDAIPRFWTMRGKYVPRRWGWDTHGLPIENIVEKKLGISGKKEIEAFGVDKFNQTARSQVLAFVHEWEKTVDRMARWVDFAGSYKTMDDDYIESVWWAFNELYDKGLVYEGTRVLPYCPRCETPIAQSEIAMDNSYRDITDLSVYVQAELVDEPGTYLVLWTTTPWTLPANTAAAVNPILTYATVRYQDKQYIVVKDRVSAVFGDDGTIVNTYPGTELVGKRFRPLFTYFDDIDLANRENGWQIYPADYVTEDMGSGIVHLAPAYGEIDMDLATKFSIPYLIHIGPDGKFLPVVTDFAGLPVKPKGDHQQTDIALIKYLAAHNLLLKKEKITHSYPHCFRCETPLYYTAIPAWFVSIQQQKDRLTELNEQIHWVPDHLKHGRFLKSMQGAPDWNISRNRYWASPLPIWKCDDGHVAVVGSREKLQALGGTVPNDLHRPYIDEVTFPCPTCEKPAKRITEVFDCWFESGSMPFAAAHYPFEQGDWFTNNFPADFVAEYIAQTRTWFYYMHVLSTTLFDSIPFRHVVTTGNVLAEDGQKMSKSKQNFPDPWLLFNRYGADAVRFYLLDSPLMKSQDLNFSEAGVDEVFKKIILRLRNVLSFYQLCDQPDETVQTADHVLDQWIQSLLAKTVQDVTKATEQYELDRAMQPIAECIDALSTWYIRRSRERLKDDPRAVATLRSVLVTLSYVLAPFTPFIAEELFQAVRSPGDPESVHLGDWPTVQEIDETVLATMARVRALVSIGLEARNTFGVRVRQPLRAVTVVGDPLEDRYTQLLAEELNVKQVNQRPGNDANLVLYFDFELDDDLRAEGLARDLTRAIQELRKVADLSPGDEAQVTISGNHPLLPLLESQLKDVGERTHTTIQLGEGKSAFERAVESLTVSLHLA